MSGRLPSSDPGDRPAPRGAGIPVEELGVDLVLTLQRSDVLFLDSSTSVAPTSPAAMLPDYPIAYPDSGGSL